MPKSLDLGRLKQFEPSTQPAKQTTTATPQADVEFQSDRWPSREPLADGQISIKGPLSTIRRFKALCKEDRRTYADMLNILMDYFDEKK